MRINIHNTLIIPTLLGSNDIVHNKALKKYIIIATESQLKNHSYRVIAA
jgi:hypothetical protein